MVRSSSILGTVADGFGIVAVRVQHEGAVVVRMVDRAQSGWTIVGAAGAQRGGVKLPHLRTIGGNERHVNRSRSGTGFSQNCGLWSLPKPSAPPPSIRTDIP